MPSLAPSLLSSCLQYCRLAVTGALATILLATSAQALNADVVVFTDRHHPVVAPKGVRVVYLDTAQQLTTLLNSNLPADPGRAAVVARQRLQESGAPLQKQLALAYQGIVDAWSLGVTHLPAVVVDSHYVIYGDPDVARALVDIATFRRARP